MSYARRLMVAVAAVCLMAAFAAPTAGAAAGNNAKASASAAKAQKNAKKAKARAAVTKKRLHLKIRNNRKYIRGTRRLMRRLGGRLRDAIAGGDKTIDDKINGIVAVVTPVLQQLGEGSLALKAGLEQLAAATVAGFDEVKAGFAEVEAGFGEVEAALTDIGDFLGATEYGIGQILINGTAQPGSFLVTPNVADDVQQAQTTMQFVATATGPIHMLVGIRSNENDGDGEENPAGYCRVTITADAYSTDSDVDGQYQSAQSFVTSNPNPAIGNAPFWPIDDKSQVTNEDEPAFPFGPVSTDLPNMENLTAGGNSTGTATATANQPYRATLSCVDISPDAEDPEA